MPAFQQGIVLAIPAHASYLSFTLKPGADPALARAALQALQPDGRALVLGVGAALAALFDKKIAGLRDFGGIAGSRVPLPATPAALWCWLRADERGELVHQARPVLQALAPAFDLQRQVYAFSYAGGRDLSGYQDGTENPRDEAALATAIVGAGRMAGSSYVAVQQWRHDFARLEAMPPVAQDAMIGRRKSDNAELEDAPESAHVKRTAQEEFEPPAFVLRRSMPWAGGSEAGLYFSAFGTSFYAFEAQLRRMSGAEDGVVDALFQFTQPLSGSYFWCPPLRDDLVDFSLLFPR
ncbi:MAG: Dyp-type peroxidase [Burkholderiales bacterium]|nr:Dyp-type peroxidase [Burkholderiales bacterium]